MVTPLLVFISACNYYDFVGSLKSVFLTARLLFPPYNYSVPPSNFFPFFNFLSCFRFLFFFLNLRAHSRSGAAAEGKASVTLD